MTTKKTLWISLACGLFLSLSFSSPAISQEAGGPIADDLHAVPYAEAGNWWDMARPGEGLVLERQGNIVAMILFTYTASGEPDFYLATAPLTISPVTAADPLPVYGSGSKRFIADGTLFRFRNGPVLNSSRRYFEGDPPANEFEPVGKINASIRPFTNTLHVKITLDEDKVPEGSERVTTRNYHKSTFGYAGFGKYVDEASEPYQASRPCWVDLRGRWVFVDNSTPATRNAWNFNFTELETSPAPEDMTCQDSWHTIQADHILIYRDPQANATLRCVSRNDDPLHNSSFQPEERRCVLRTGEGEGEPLLWFSVKDVGARQIIATPGAPPNDYKLWRGLLLSERITGLRVD